MKQKGFTLVEMLGALVIGGMVIAAAAGILHQLVLGTDRSNSQVIALNDVSNAALAIRKDLEMTQETTLIDGDPNPQGSVVLSWIDYTFFEADNQTAHSSTYSLSGTELLRSYDGTVNIVGRYITYIGFTQDGRMVSVSINATGPGAGQRRETLHFSVQTRTEGVAD